MSFKQSLFVKLARISRLGGLDKRFGRSHRGAGSIFIGHSVVPETAEYLFDNLRTSAAFMETVVRYVRNEGLDIVTLDEALRRLDDPSANRFVCFTFDDGYKDNLTVALSIFERYQAPFTVFVTTSLIERTIDHWWSGLAEIIRHNDEFDIPQLGERFQARTFTGKVRLFKRLKAARECETLTEAGLSDVFSAHNVNLPRIVERDALTIAELRRLADHPLVTIGGHTRSHPHLSSLDAAQAHDEMTDNKNWLEDIIQGPVVHFAYPYGSPHSCGAREAALARRAGFRTALTTRIGNLFPPHLQQPTALPRLRLFSEREDINLIRFQLSGGAGALLNRSGGPVVTM